MISKNNFEALFLANSEEIRMSGGLRYIIVKLSQAGVNKNILNEIIIKHTKEYPEKFEEFSKLI